MIRNAYFVPDMLDQLIVEFQQYNKDGKWYTANEIRELIDVLERLRHCARVQSNQPDELQRDRSLTHGKFCNDNQWNRLHDGRKRFNGSN